MSAYQLEHKRMIEEAGAPYITATAVQDVVKAMALPVLEVW